MSSRSATLAKVRSPAVLVAQNGNSLALPNYMADEVECSRASIMAVISSSSSLGRQSRLSCASGSVLPARNSGDGEEKSDSFLEPRTTSRSHPSPAFPECARIAPASPRSRPQQPSEPLGAATGVPFVCHSRRGSTSPVDQTPFGTYCAPATDRPRTSDPAMAGYASIMSCAGQGVLSRRPPSAAASTRAQAQVEPTAAVGALEADPPASATGRAAHHHHYDSDDDSLDEEGIALDLDAAHGTLALALERARGGHMPSSSAGGGNCREGRCSGTGALSSSPLSRPSPSAAAEIVPNTRTSAGEVGGSGLQRHSGSAGPCSSQQLLAAQDTPSSSPRSQPHQAPVRRFSAHSNGVPSIAGCGYSCSGRACAARRSRLSDSSTTSTQERTSRTCNGDTGGVSFPVTNTAGGGGKYDGPWSVQASSAANSRTLSGISASGVSSCSAISSPRGADSGWKGTSPGSGPTRHQGRGIAAASMDVPVDIESSMDGDRSSRPGGGRCAVGDTAQAVASDLGTSGRRSPARGSLKGLMKLAKRAFRRSIGVGVTNGGDAESSKLVSDTVNGVDKGIRPALPSASTQTGTRRCQLPSGSEEASAGAGAGAPASSSAAPGTFQRICTAWVSSGGGDTTGSTGSGAAQSTSGGLAAPVQGQASPRSAVSLQTQVGDGGLAPAPPTADVRAGGGGGGAVSPVHPSGHQYDTMSTGGGGPPASEPQAAADPQPFLHYNQQQLVQDPQQGQSLHQEQTAVHVFSGPGNASGSPQLSIMSLSQGSSVDFAASLAAAGAGEIGAAGKAAASGWQPVPKPNRHAPRRSDALPSAPDPPVPPSGSEPQAQSQS